MNKTPRHLAALSLNPDIYSVKDLKQPKSGANSNSNQVKILRKISDPGNEEQKTNQSKEFS